MLRPRRLPATVYLEASNAMTTKETARAILDRLPDNCSIADALYQLYVVQAVVRGDADVAAGSTKRRRGRAGRFGDVSGERSSLRQVTSDGLTSFAS